MRKKIFDIIEKAEEGNRASHFYDVFMIAVIAISMVPLALKESNSFFLWVEWITTGIFILDYLLRWLTADLKIQKGAASFLLYPVSLMAIVDMLAILPSILVINKALRVLKAFRLIRALRVFKVLKGFRYSKNIEVVASVFKKQKRSLATVSVLTVGYIMLSALIVFNVEPETFGSYFDAVYWATVSLTTVGYGDICTVSVVGKAVTMVSSILGVAVVALPAGIITAGYMSEIQKDNGEE